MKLLEKLGKYFYPYFLGEKWFYCKSRRQKIKLLENQSG